MESIYLDDSIPAYQVMMPYASALWKRAGYMCVWVEPKERLARVDFAPGFQPMLIVDILQHPFQSAFFWFYGVMGDTVHEPLVVKKANMCKYLIELGKTMSAKKHRFREPKEIPKEFYDFAKAYASEYASYDRQRMAAVDKLSWEQRLALRKAQLEDTSRPKDKILGRIKKRKPKPKA